MEMRRLFIPITSHCTGFGQTKRFEPINRFRNIVLNITEAAVSGTLIAQNHKAGRSGTPAFAFIGAISACTNGI